MCTGFYTFLVGHMPAEFSTPYIYHDTCRGVVAWHSQRSQWSDDDGTDDGVDGAARQGRTHCSARRSRLHGLPLARSAAGFSPNPTPVGADAIMADCTYANVLADSLGLSPLTTDAQVVSHLAKVLQANDSPFGFIVPKPGGQTRHTQKEVW